MKKILNIVVLLILKFLSLFIRKESMVIIGTYSRYRYGGNTKYLYEYFGKQNYFRMSKFSRSPQSFIAKSVLDDIKKRLKF